MEKFLVLIIIIISMLLGVALFFVVTYMRITKRQEEEFKALENYFKKFLDNISVREDIDVNKYLRLTNQQMSQMKGGEEDE
jgi:ABC-type transport system involved in cytochrome bd biosynthesis fused ATPase/permease subunit